MWTSRFPVFFRLTETDGTGVSSSGTHWSSSSSPSVAHLSPLTESVTPRGATESGREGSLGWAFGDRGRPPTREDKCECPSPSACWGPMASSP